MTSSKENEATVTQDPKVAQLGIDPDPSEQDEDVSSQEKPGPKRVWIRFMTLVHWYPKDMPYEEKSLTLKLDLSILIFGCLSFFTKYLDQQSITNAYVR
jgi:ACS family pantothenate transporter-like MFS transporter